MFAFAIWDQRRRRLLLARDRFGEKPLFLHEHGGELTVRLRADRAGRPSSRSFASSTRPRSTPSSCSATCPGRGTIVAGRAPAAARAPAQLGARERARRASATGGRRPRRARSCASPSRSWPPRPKRLFRASVRTRLIADVPLGVFLSGGVDSTLVAAVAGRAVLARRSRPSPSATTSATVDETARRPARRRALGTEHHELIAHRRPRSPSARPRCSAGLDQPLADRRRRAAARALGVRPPAGDRGARRRGRRRAVRRLSPLPLAAASDGALEAALPDGAVRSLGGLLRHAGRAGSGGGAWPAGCAPTPILERNLDWVTSERRHSRQALYGPRLRALDRARVLDDLGARAGELNGTSTARWLMHLDQIDYLPDDVLVKTDRASMAVSLEIRTVFLHGGLAELAASRGHVAAPRRRGQGACARDAPCRYRTRPQLRSLSQDGLQSSRRRVAAWPVGAGAAPPVGARSDLRAGIFRRAMRSRRLRTSTSHSQAITAIGCGPCWRSGCGPTASAGSMALNGGRPTAKRPRLLILTPDYPPERGGVQVLIHRTAGGMNGFETLVLAPDSPGAAEFDRDSAVAIERVAAPRAATGGDVSRRLNAAALGRALRFRPDIVLSAHIVVSPAAAAIRRALGARTCQYFHAEEIGAKPQACGIRGSPRAAGGRAERLHGRPRLGHRSAGGEDQGDPPRRRPSHRSDAAGASDRRC